MVQQRFALLWGPGAYDIYNAKMQNPVAIAEAPVIEGALGDPSARVFEVFLIVSNSQSVF